MKELLGNNLKQFFDRVDNPPNSAEITYKGNKYEVWELSDELFDKMCDMAEEEFSELANDYAWWVSSKGSSLCIPDKEFTVNGKYLLAWDSPIYENNMYEYHNLSEYLYDCIGYSQPRNVCALAIDLAKYNNMTMAELFEKYEG